MNLDRRHTAFSFKNAPIKIIATEISGPPATRAVKTGGPLISVAMIFIGAFLNEKAVCRLSKFIHNKSSGRKNL